MLPPELYKEAQLVSQFSPISLETKITLVVSPTSWNTAGNSVTLLKYFQLSEFSVSRTIISL